MYLTVRNYTEMIQMNHLSVKSLSCPLASHFFITQYF